MELSSAFLTLPLGAAAYIFIKERKNHFINLKRVNLSLKALIFLGLPTVHLYFFGVYRRYFTTQKHEYILKLRYS
jgi:hypothetical protein